MIGRKFSSLLVAVAVALVVACVGLAVGAGTALACVVNPNDNGCVRTLYHVQRTDGSLAQWSGPGTGRVVGWLYGNGTAVQVVCETTGATEDGLPYVVWDKLDDGTYVYGYYLDTPGDGYNPALTQCPGSPGSAPPPPKPAPPPHPTPPVCPAAPASVPQPPGAGPAPGSGPRPGTYIEHAQWVWVRYQNTPTPLCGWSLQVTPTFLARALAFSGVSPAPAGWNELYSDYKNVGRGIKHNVDGLREQYYCHQMFVAIRSPHKATWDLDEWRPDVSYLETVKALCNP